MKPLSDYCGFQRMMNWVDFSDVLSGHFRTADKQNEYLFLKIMHHTHILTINIISDCSSYVMQYLK